VNYRVEMSESAEAEADQIYLWISQRSPESAARWYSGLLKACQSLSVFPHRFPVLPRELAVRRMLYGKYRVLYRIVEPQDEEEEGIVRVLHIHHGARQQTDE
jgi:plasmid stabilization system protein ParE